MNSSIKRHSNAKGFSINGRSLIYHKQMRVYVYWSKCKLSKLSPKMTFDKLNKGSFIESKFLKL